MLKCNTCGRENPISNSFCEGCGSPLSFIDQDLTSTGLPHTDSLESAEPVVNSTPVEPEVKSEPVQSYSYQQPQATSVSYDYNSNNTNYNYQYSYNPDQSVKTSAMCITGFVLSLVSLLCCGFTSLISLILSIIGLILASGKGMKGKGLAIAGIIISSILLIFFIILVIASADGGFEYSNYWEY